METVKAQELKRRIEHNNEILVLDVLPSKHYESQHIPGAKNIPLERGDFVDRVGEVAKNKQQQIVVYCANSDCDLSPKAAKRLEGAGYENIVDFDEGIEAWKDAGYTVSKE